MSLKQCPACGAMMDAVKSFCSDCGAPMEEELKRSRASEFDSFTRTQNIDKTAQLRMLEDFNISSIFAKPTLPDEPEGNVPQPPPVFSPPARPEAQFNRVKPETIVLKPYVENPAVKKSAAASNKNLYIAVGAGLIFIVLIFIVLIVAGVLFFYFSR